MRARLPDREVNMAELRGDARDVGEGDDHGSRVRPAPVDVAERRVFHGEKRAVTAPLIGHPDSLHPGNKEQA